MLNPIPLKTTNQHASLIENLPTSAHIPNFMLKKFGFSFLGWRTNINKVVECLSQNICPCSRSNSPGEKKKLQMALLRDKPKMQNYDTLGTMNVRCEWLVFYKYIATVETLAVKFRRCK